ncbi:MAG: RidA family protein [Deltaproteobacteria bacterium]|nr:RidA family protein [Deltaproteobacteria bacterium]
MKTILTENAPAPIGPYSQAIQAGDFLFLSGQIPLDPKTNQVMLFDGDVAKQTELVLKNISAILTAESLTFNAIVKTTIFLRDLNQFQKVNETYANFFKNHKPARSTIEVSNLPKGVAIEIEAIAVL